MKPFNGDNLIYWSFGFSYFRHKCNITDTRDSCQVLQGRGRQYPSLGLRDMEHDFEAPKTSRELSPHLSSINPSHLEVSEDSQLGDSGESWHLDHEGHVRAQAGTISVQDFSDGCTLVRQSEIRQSLASGMETIVGRSQRPRRTF